jgi:hypothetical protein
MLDMQRKPALMAAGNFTAADLTANRNGMLTETQRANLKRWSGGMRVFGVIAFAVFAVIAGIGGFIFLYSPEGQSLKPMFDKNPELVYIIGGVGALILLVVFWSVLRSLLRSNELRAGRISVVEGRARRQIRRSTRAYLTSYMVTIGNVKFHITPELHDEMVDNATYRVYYVKNPPAHVILSLEPV